MRELLLALQTQADITVGQALLAGVAVLLIGVAGTLVSRRRCETDVAEALAIIADHNERAAQWLGRHQLSHPEWYFGPGRHHRRPVSVDNTPTLTLPRVEMPASGMGRR